MGIQELLSFDVPLPLLLGRGLATATTSLSETPAGAQPPTVRQAGPAAPRVRGGPGLAANREQQIEDAFQAIVYRSQVTEMSLAARFQEIAARVAQDRQEGSVEAETQVQQLTFDFFAETRTEELIRFNERTENVAEGLDATRSTTYLAMSREIAARFEFSMSISGAALNGFAGASENAQDLGDVIDQLLGLAQQLLEASGEAFDEFWSIFDGFTLDSAQERFTALFNQLAEQFLSGAFITGLQEAAGAGEGAAVSSVSVQLEFCFSFSASISVQQEIVQESDPIILDLDGDGYELTNHRDGARFDIQGNGARARTAFVTGGDAFLAIDRNGDGIINSGRELFGDQNGAVNGFEELRKFDSNGDNVINRLDKDFDRLLLFRDNGNGFTEAGELLTLKDAGIDEISLHYEDVNARTSGGNRLGQITSFRRTDGTRGAAADAILNFTA